MADGIDEAHLARCEALFDCGDESQGHLDRLRSLRDDTEPRMCGNLVHIFFREHHNGLRMIANEPANLHMRALADDDGLVTLTHEHGESLVSLVNERAGRVGDLASAFSPRATIYIGGPVSGDDDVRRFRAAQIVKLTASCADGAKMTIHQRIVDELTEDGDGLAFGRVVRGPEGVTHAEAHAVVLSEEDVHRVFLGSWFLVLRCSFLLCGAK
jgi:hypothetical protein